VIVGGGHEREVTREGSSIDAMAPPGSAGDVEALLAEQIAYYRARAPEYTKTAFPEVPEGDLAHARDQMVARLDAFRPSGDLLELACGPGSWTPELLAHADAVTAVDASPEMLTLARQRVPAGAVRFIEADLFRWRPDRRYDVVFFAFWLSHVPLERFEDFWGLVDRALKPEGRVAFVDDAFRTPEELIGGEGSSTIRRRLNDGTAFRAVKVPHTAESLKRRIRRLGWEVEVVSLSGPFFWGEGSVSR
jgi:demethylmenaquinone methyltransferase/2-methoxy-6-polyprenyl-1,4-benzoquinol methylase